MRQLHDTLFAAWDEGLQNRYFFAQRTAATARRSMLILPRRTERNRAPDAAVEEAPELLLEEGGESAGVGTGGGSSTENCAPSLTPR